MRSLKMRLVRIGIPVDFENPDPYGIVDFANGIEGDDAWLDPYGGFDLHVDRSFEGFELRRIDLGFRFLHIWSVYDSHPDIWVANVNFSVWCNRRLPRVRDLP
jgi:hypothetical protein